MSMHLANLSLFSMTHDTPLICWTRKAACTAIGLPSQWQVSSSDGEKVLLSSHSAKLGPNIVVSLRSSWGRDRKSTNLTMFCERRLSPS